MSRATAVRRGPEDAYGAHPPGGVGTPFKSDALIPSVLVGESEGGMCRYLPELRATDETNPPLTAACRKRRSCAISQKSSNEASTARASYEGETYRNEHGTCVHSRRME
jgi:hypothetical protein